MPYQRPIFATLSILAFVTLAILSRRRPYHPGISRTYFFFCLCNALWVTDEYTVFIPQHDLGLWFHRAVGVGGCFLIPFLMDYVYQVTEIRKTAAQVLRKAAYALAVVLSVLHLTPAIYADVQYTPFQVERIVQVPGALYPAFGLFLVIGLVCTFAALPFLYFPSAGQKRKDIGILLLSCCFGAGALVFFLLSFMGRDLPWIYFPCQILLGITIGLPALRKAETPPAI